MSRAGNWAYQAGTTGTCTVPVNAVVTQIRCESHSNVGALTIFGGDSILVNGDAGAGQHLVLSMDLANDNGPCKSTPLANTIVFSNMTSWFVGYVL